MLPLSELPAVSSRWSGTLRWKPRYRLASGDQLFATLDWETASGSLVVARWKDRVALIERSSFAGGRVVIRDGAHGPELGEFVASWTDGGRFTLRSGSTWGVQPESGSLSRWSVRDVEKRSVLELRVDSMRLLPAGSLTLGEGMALLPELPLLVTMSWYVAVQAVDDGVMLPVGSTSR